ncbi:MAG: sialate O-acetylesterase, partial [Planctomycetaceae bacterium]
DDCPAVADRPDHMSGFVWFQGWNDDFGPQTAREEYEQNLVNLILDVRREFDVPELPVVIGELGNDGDQANDQIKAIRRAQAAAAARKELGNHVAFVPTTAFARPANQSPNVTHGHHWYGNAESYFLVGDALGKAMLKLQTAARRAR